jgi:uncharacterized protein
VRVLVSGAGGLIGSALLPSLREAGHSVARLSRPGSARGGDDVEWDPLNGRLDAARLGGFDAVVHLAGESIAAGRWTAARKARIRDSRVVGTRLLSESMARAKPGPAVLVSASAIGWYGNRGDEILREDSRPGGDFLAAVCRDWEDATGPAASAGRRVVRLRFGVILSRDGGALARMLLPFRLGLGGRVGSGRQFMSWIAIGDAVGAIRHAIERGDLSGPVNAVAPGPVTNAAFTAALARALRRPALIPMPAFMARLAFGEMGEALLLASQRVEPARLVASGYRFRHAEVEAALRDLLSP